ncbi:MAG: hypothetical protein IT323_11580 [Anaerolineae bacterium]|nr:hypothetical protein [Anaerolineae bacterium]
MIVVALDQQAETPPRREVIPGAIIRAVYARSRDAARADAPGQDFIAYAHDKSRLVFAVCDGVSQSFFGDLAARFLGMKLVERLAECGLEDLEAALLRWTTSATALVAAQPLSASLPPMVRNALESKRASGSETMFVAGVVDLERGELQACWMGDMRLRLWDLAGQEVAIPGAAWETRERWSSRIGPKNGAPRQVNMPLDGIGHITAHSDGFSDPRGPISRFAPDELDALIRTLALADDVSLLDVMLTRADLPTATLLAAPAGLYWDALDSRLSWPPVEGARWYRVEVNRPGQPPTWADVVGRMYRPRFDDLDAPAELSFRVQTFGDDGLPGPWSAPVQGSTAPPPEYPPTPGATPVIAPARPEPEPSIASPIDRDYMPPGPSSAPRDSRYRTGPVMILALLLALALSIGWIALNLPR